MSSAASNGSSCSRRAEVSLPLINDLIADSQYQNGIATLVAERRDRRRVRCDTAA